MGDVVGVCGSTGKSTAPHLHFEIFVNGRRVDPAPYIGLDEYEN
ncbi:M23 family metallopeptidase [Paenibacillus sp. J5C2022]|nr:M23 family metallopeptidase [Paenibacillus sp. J5C2022]